MPHAFTEQGVAMLSGILNSDRAIAVNIQIMRTFTKLRHMISDNEDLRQELAELREQTDERFQIVFETLDQLLIMDSKEKKKIGFMVKEKVAQYRKKNQEGIFFYEQGGSGSSGQRYNHGFYGHLFALFNNEKPVATYFLTYNSRNQFIFNRKEKSLHLHFFDLVGNFHIDWKESEQILKNVTKSGINLS